MRKLLPSNCRITSSYPLVLVDSASELFAPSVPGTRIFSPAPPLTPTLAVFALSVATPIVQPGVSVPIAGSVTARPAPGALKLDKAFPPSAAVAVYVLTDGNDHRVVAPALPGRASVCALAGVTWA